MLTIVKENIGTRNSYEFLVMPMAITIQFLVWEVPIRK